MRYGGTGRTGSPTSRRPTPHSRRSPPSAHPTPRRSWVTAAGAVLDAASITASTLDQERSTEAQLCIRAGYLALRKISNVFGIPFDPYNVVLAVIGRVFRVLRRPGAAGRGLRICVERCRCGVS